MTRLRWIIQVVSFVTILYGGFAVQEGSRLLDEVRGGHPAPSRALPENLKWVEKRTTVTTLHLPATSCIYQRQGLCRGCSLYYLSDVITWLKPLGVILPSLTLLLLLMLLGGRLWCGWVCPLGFLSDLLTQLRAWTGIAQVRVSRRARDGLLWAKYALLFFSLGIAALAALPSLAEHRLSLLDPFCQICPSRLIAAFFTFDRLCWTNFRDAITMSFMVLGWLAFALFFVGLTVRRFWCRLCPIGGLSALFNKTGMVMLVKNKELCTRCGTCARVCPLDIDRVHEDGGRPEVTAYECHLCLRCVDACPERGCLAFRWLGKRAAGSGGWQGRIAGIDP